MRRTQPSDVRQMPSTRCTNVFHLCDCNVLSRVCVYVWYVGVVVSLLKIGDANATHHVLTEHTAKDTYGGIENLSAADEVPQRRWRRTRMRT